VFALPSELWQHKARYTSTAEVTKSMLLQTEVGVAEMAIQTRTKSVTYSQVTASASGTSLLSIQKLTS